MEKEPILDTAKFHEIWVEQCEAAEGIKRRYGTKVAFDYLVAEKLFNFADAASSHPASRESFLGLSRMSGACLQSRRCGHTLIGFNASSGMVMPTSASATSSMKRVSKKTRSASKGLRQPRSALGNSQLSQSY
jgi:hypothetical protein